MSETDKDLFGKIDALFEKRAPDVLVDKGLEHEDFPVLTEVIGQVPPVGQEAAAASSPPRMPPGGAGVDEGRRADRRVADRRQGDRRQSADRPSSPLSGREVEQLMQSMELRLSDLFIRQQLRMEEAIRKVLREELAKHGSQPRDGEAADRQL